MHRLIIIHCQTLNKFLRSKNLISDDEAVTTVEDGLPRIRSVFRPTLTRPILVIRIRPVRKLTDSEFVPLYKDILSASQ